MTKEDKAALNRLIAQPVFRKAIEEVCMEIWTESRTDVTGLEAAALAFKFGDGAITALNKLLAKGNMSHPLSLLPTRLKTES